MNHRKKRLLHESELAVMQVIWEQGEVSDAHLQKALSAAEGLDRTKIIETIRELVQRGVITQREEETTYVYSALVSRREVEEALLRDLHGALFEGSDARMIRAFVEHGIVSKERLREIVRDL